MDTIQKKPEGMTIVGKDMENLGSLCTVDGNVKWWSAMENIIAILQDIKNRMTRRFSHSTWYRPQRTDSKVLKRYLYIHIHGSLIHNSQEMEDTQVFIDRWMDKVDAICTYSGLLFTLKKKEILAYAPT